MSAEVSRPAPALPTARDLGPAALHALAAAILFGLVSALYLRHALTFAAGAPYWMDEVLAVWTARQPDLGAIWTALLGGAEFSPPGYHVLLHAMVEAGATGPLAMRFPSIVAIYLAAVAVGLLVRRRSSWPVAAAAAGIVLCSGLFAYAVQARPYALVTVAIAWALFVWDDIAEDDARAGWRIPALAALLATAVALHFYAVLLVGLLGLAEALRSAACRTLRPRVLAAIGFAAATILVWWPIMRAAGAFNAGDVWAPSYYARPSFEAMLHTYLRLLISPAPAILASWILFAGLTLARRTSPMERRLTGLAALFCCVPAVVLLFAATVSHTYNDRYAIGVVLGVALLTAALLQGLGALADRAALVVLVALTACSATVSGGEIARPERTHTIAGLLAMPADLPVATGDGLRFLEMSEALPPRSASRLVFLRVPDTIVSGDPTNRHQVERWAAMRPDLTVAAARDFLCRTPRFLLLSDPAGGWDDLPAWLAGYAQIAPTGEAALSLVTPARCPAE